MKYPVCYYFKCSKTGVELNFTQDDRWGWCIQFIDADFLEDSPDTLLEQAGVQIPWPELSPEEQKEVDNNYKELYKMLGKDE